MKIQSLLSKVLFLLILAFVGVVCAIFFSKNNGDRSGISSAVYHQSQWNGYAPEVERALKANQSASTSQFLKLDLKHIYGGVVSHHIPTTIPRLVKFYSRLKETQSVKNFIVIGPDHNDAGKSPVTVSNASFFTTFGEVKPVDGLAMKLQDAGFANIEEAPFDPEHSIGSQMLVVSKIFPDARVTPIIIRSDTTEDHAEALGKMLSTMLDDETVLIASVDFSHYLSTNQALPLDQISGEIIRNLDLDALPLVKADSGKSMAVFVNAMIAKGATDTDDFEVLNTNDLMQNTDYTTGYVFGYWGKK